MTVCACCRRRGRCARPCATLQRHLPSMRQGELPTFDAAKLDGFAEPQDPRRHVIQRVMQLLARRWDHLTPRQKQVLHLLYVEGLSQSQVGRRLGISQAMVHKHRRRAIDQVRRREVMESRIQ